MPLWVATTAGVPERRTALVIGNAAYQDTARRTAVHDAEDLERRCQEASYQEWYALRQNPEARWLSLALPRFLLRLPYGSETEPADTFAFEEQPSGSDHDRLLWGNPAFAIAAVVAQVFSTEGWSLDVSRTVHRMARTTSLYLSRRGNGESQSLR